MRHAISNAALDAGDICILGRKGSGKTYAAKGLVERLLKRGRRVIIIDPMNVWAGLRVGADGVSAGFPVLIVGGAGGDIPVLDTSAEGGARVGRCLLGCEVSVVLDVSEQRRPENMSFVAAVLREIYEGHTGEPLWIVLEEADMWAPQAARSSEAQAVLAEVEMMARRGRSKGLRLISVTQRPARLHKDVLSQFDTMAVLAMPGLQDRRAIRDWMEGVTDEAESVFASLPSLSVGEGWVWTPRERVLSQEKFPAITTLDTSATPGVGSRRSHRGGLDDEALSRLREVFAAVATPTAPTGALRTIVGGRHRRVITAAGDAILELRRRANLSQKELAALIGSEQKAISRMESGRTFASSRVLERIAEKLHCTLRIEFVPGEDSLRSGKQGNPLGGARVR